jgi:hypothetical protein
LENRKKLIFDDKNILFDQDVQPLKRGQTQYLSSRRDITRHDIKLGYFKKLLFAKFSRKYKTLNKDQRKIIKILGVASGNFLNIGLVKIFILCVVFTLKNFYENKSKILKKNIKKYLSNC